jgi:hypothetical protein
MNLTNESSLSQARVDSLAMCFSDKSAYINDFDYNVIRSTDDRVQWIISLFLKFKIVDLTAQNDFHIKIYL